MDYVRGTVPFFIGVIITPNFSTRRKSKTPKLQNTKLSRALGKLLAMPPDESLHSFHRTFYSRRCNSFGSMLFVKHFALLSTLWSHGHKDASWGHQDTSGTETSSNSQKTATEINSHRNQQQHQLKSIATTIDSGQINSNRHQQQQKATTEISSNRNRQQRKLTATEINSNRDPQEQKSLSSVVCVCFPYDCMIQLAVSVPFWLLWLCSWLFLLEAMKLA